MKAESTILFTAWPRSSPVMTAPPPSPTEERMVSVEAWMAVNMVVSSSRLQRGGGRSDTVTNSFLKSYHIWRILLHENSV